MKEKITRQKKNYSKSKNNVTEKDKRPSLYFTDFEQVFVG